MGVTSKPLNVVRKNGRFVSGANYKQTHGMSHTRVYMLWLQMRKRCYYPKVAYYENYGGRGIRVCERWHDFENFLADMGEPAPGMSLDRIDNDGNYEPGNCRWATAREQSRNSRWTKLTFEDATAIAVARLRGETCRSIAKRFGLSARYPGQIARGLYWPDALAAAKEIVGE